jgi:Predicted methyltransferase
MEKIYSKKIALGVNKTFAEEVRYFLNKMDLIDRFYHVLRENENVFFPLKKPLTEMEINEIRKIVPDFILTEKNMLGRRKILKIKEIVEKFKEERLITKTPTRYLSINGIIIAEINEEKFQKEIIEYFCLIKKDIEAIYKINNINLIHKGKKPQLIFGKEIHEYKLKEKDIILHFNFSDIIPDPRLMLFLREISNEISFNEMIAEIGATLGYASILIAKKYQNFIYAFEDEIRLYTYLTKNVKLNGVERFVLPIYLNTLNLNLKSLRDKFDRVIISKPAKFLDLLNFSLQLIKSRGKLCLFAISKEEDYSDVRINIEEELLKKNYKILNFSFKKVLNLFINENLVYCELSILKE